MADNFQAGPFTFRSKDNGGIHAPGMFLADAAGADAMGAVDPSPAANTMLGRLKAIADGLSESSTEAKQDAANVLLTAIRDALADDPTAAGLSAVATALVDKATGADVATVTAALGETLSVSAEALPLPAGAATGAKQDANTAAIRKLGSAKRWFAITPNGNADLATVPDAIYIGGAGNLVLKGDDGTNATFAVTSGQILPVSPMRVLASGTTATELVGLVA